MTTVPDIPVVRLPALDVDGDESGPTNAPASVWAVDVPDGRRLSPVTLAAVGVVAGVAALAVGTAAVISAGAGASRDATAGTTPAAVGPVATGSGVATAERRALALLAKPSTERVAFRGVQGLVLAVGSGGRAAILVRGLGPAPAGTPYVAWVVAPGARPVPAARFVGTERAVFISRRLGPQASVVIGTGRPLPGPAARNRIVALRS